MQVLKVGKTYRIIRFTVGHFSTKIQCLNCNHMSGNPHHVQDKYCPHCEEYHKE